MVIPEYLYGKRKMIKLSISLWSAALAKLGEAIKETEKYADYFHFDVADGHFVPNFLFFPDLIKALRPLTSVPFEVHLIIEKPERFVSLFVDAGADVLAIHPRASKNPEEVITKIKNYGIKASLVLDSDVSVEEVKPFINMVDFVTVMGTPIGVKGCSLLPQTYTKIRELKEYFSKLNIENVYIEVDGGIRRETAPQLVKAGADILVAGSLFFNNQYDEVSRWLKSLKPDS